MSLASSVACSDFSNASKRAQLSQWPQRAVAVHLGDARSGGRGAVEVATIPETLQARALGRANDAGADVVFELAVLAEDQGAAAVEVNDTRPAHALGLGYLEVGERF